jgi:single-strand DNA-binding protein
MASENSVTLVGNLTKDPELRYTATGRGVASFGIAVNRRYQVNGEWQEQVSFFNVVAWAISARTPPPA